MRKEEDIFKIYNQMNDMIDSINIGNEESKKEMPEMPKAFVDDNENHVIYKENVHEVEEIKEEIKDINELLKENKKNVRKKKKNKSKLWVIIFAILDVIAITCLFLMYGPLSFFRNFWVTSAMSTMEHHYLAYIFFNDDVIQEIMSSNVIIEVEGNTNQDEINFEEQPSGIIEYSSPEEEQILKKDEGNDLYKVIDIEGNGYKGHMLVVYDPSKLKLKQITNMKYGKTIEKFVKEYNAVAGTNAGGFNYSDRYGYTPTGTVIIDGQILNDGVATGWGGGIVGFTEDNVLVLTKSSAQEAIQMGIRDAISFGPFLIVNGVASEFKGNGGYGVAPRTAIGQRKDGIVLLLVIDGRRPGHSIGVDMVELTNIMQKYGAYNASNLDGGGSSTIVVNGETLSVAGGYGYKGDRYLHNAWLLIP